MINELIIGQIALLEDIKNIGKEVAEGKKYLAVIVATAEAERIYNQAISEMEKNRRIEKNASILKMDPRWKSLVLRARARIEEAKQNYEDAKQKILDIKQNHKTLQVMHAEQTKKINELEIELRAKERLYAELHLRKQNSKPNKPDNAIVSVSDKEKEEFIRAFSL